MIVMVNLAVGPAQADVVAACPPCPAGDPATVTVTRTVVQYVPIPTTVTVAADPATVTQTVQADPATVTVTERPDPVTVTEQPDPATVVTTLTTTCC